MSASALFIADIHLDEEGDLSPFIGFLGEANRYDALYILGDLFDAWLGDDIGLESFEPVITGLKQLSAAGTQIHFIPGNHDFLVGEAFYRASGCQPLPDGTLLQLGGERVLLLHGDTLCSRDLEYQAFRRQIQDPAKRPLLLAMPVAERVAVGRSLRAQSREATAQKPLEVMDATAESIQQAMLEQSASMLIHGHTHRPETQQFELNGRSVTRFVLPPWHDAAGGVEYDDEAGFQPATF
ncbi:MAG: UDP-2,3-diacylglucosamine diphosphatase [Gammaproteobacteria bacterium]|nr:UDP-2,3-diacylglucosamine diphosphatase [Gammaproteobacteria bacterium]